MTEWASVLDIELPDDDPDRQYRICWLAESVAKGGYGRKYWMPRSVLTETLSYIEGERAAAIGRARDAGRYERVEAAHAERETAPHRPGEHLRRDHR